jgi:hypothetical protein
MFDQAVVRPDLFEARFSFPYRIIHAWNPTSKEAFIEFSEEDMKNNPIPNKKSDNSSSPGEPRFSLPLLGETKYNPKKFKYVIVPAGHENLATSGRLASLLAHSGAVILLQSHPFGYHFSSRLEPWVHYVPLSFNMADATEKVEWLQSHDDMAKQIAANARNFGKSYLRLEDYFCYTATALKSFANLEDKTDATTPFNPIHMV